MRFMAISLFLFFSLALASTNWRPVVMMHGLLSSADDLVEAKEWIESDFPVSGMYY